MSNFTHMYTNREEITYIDEQGEEHTTIKETTNKLEKVHEPDYIKLYISDLWFNADGIPKQCVDLFIMLAMRMSYADSKDRMGGQIVSTTKSVREDIQSRLGIGENMFRKYIAALCQCGAIRKTSVSEYQINPAYAGRGLWKYNPRQSCGGIEDIFVHFEDKSRAVEQKVVFADDGTDLELNKVYRKGLGLSSDDEFVLKTRTSKPSEENIFSAEEEDIFN